MKKASPATIVAQLLPKEISERTEILFLPCPGNGGDALITYESYRVLNDSGLNFLALPSDGPLPPLQDRIIVIGGGGGLVPHYQFLPKLLLAVANSALKVIVLPQSIRGMESLIDSLPASVHLLVRDEISFEHAVKYAKKANIYASEDMALTIDAGGLLSAPPSTLRYLRHQLSISKYHFRIAAQQALAWLGLLARTRLHQFVTSDRTLFAIRSDIEATIAPPIGRRNIDISSEFEYNDMSEIGSKLNSYRMLKFISLHKKVVTNRLHVGIGAHLLGIETQLLDNSYGKIGAVYTQSLTEDPQITLIKNL